MHRVPGVYACVCVCIRVCCIHVCICEHAVWYMHMHAYTYRHACGGQKPTLDIFLHCFPPYFLKQGPSANLKLTNFTRLLTGQQALGFLLSSMPGFFMGTGDLNLSLHTDVAVTLPSELSHQPLLLNDL